MISFNIFAQVDEEIKDYLTKKIKIGGGSKASKRLPYEFSQYDTIDLVDYYTNSKFELGEKDSTNKQQKYFINEVDFRREVASKNIDLDVKHFAFIPEEDQSEYGAIFLRKMFRKWAKESNFGELINDMVELFPKYGTVVVQNIGNDVEIVPLQKLRVKQDAKDLQTAQYVIVENECMTYSDMQKYKGWDLSKITGSWDTEYQVYTRYGNVPLSWYKEYKGESIEDGDEKKSIDVVVVIAPDAEAKTPDGKILFCEEIDERPFLEVHYAKQQGRWLGIGEVEKQFENQKIRNMVFNLRKQSLVWSAKNIFQTQDDTVINSLVREVKDGDILKITTANGIQRVDTTNRASADYNTIDQLVTDNANQRSFTFEIATGESMPSGTPFRLGAVLANSVDSYYGGKRERLGLFLSKIVRDFKLPEFEKSLEDEGVIAVFANDEDFEKLRTAKKKVMVNKAIKEKVLNNNFDINKQEMENEVESKLVDKEMDTYSFTKEDLKNLKYTVAIETTGESIDIPAKMTSLTTLYQTLAQLGDPRAEIVLKKIMALAGEKLPPKPMQAPQLPQMPSANEMIQPNETGETQTISE